MAIGRVPGIYKTWYMANTQVEGFSSACYGGFDDIQECVDFMIAKGDFNEDTMHVYGQRGGQYTLRNWQRKLGVKNNEDKSTPPSSEGCVPAAPPSSEGCVPAAPPSSEGCVPATPPSSEGLARFQAKLVLGQAAANVKIRGRILFAVRGCETILFCT